MTPYRWEVVPFIYLIRPASSEVVILSSSGMPNVGDQSLFVSYTLTDENCFLFFLRLHLIACARKGIPSLASWSRSDCLGHSKV